MGANERSSFARVEVQMAARERQYGTGFRTALAGQDLIDAQIARFELQGGRGHVQAPYAVDRLTHILERARMAPLQPPHPCPQRERVVPSQPFDIGDLEV